MVFQVRFTRATYSWQDGNCSALGVFPQLQAMGPLPRRAFLVVWGSCQGGEHLFFWKVCLYLWFPPPGKLSRGTPPFLRGVRALLPGPAQIWETPVLPFPHGAEASGLLGRAFPELTRWLRRRWRPMRPFGGQGPVFFDEGARVLRMTPKFTPLWGELAGLSHS